MDSGITTEYSSMATTTTVDISGAGPAGKVFAPVFDTISTNSYFSFDGILGFLNNLWFAYAIFAYLLCIGLLVLYVYAASGQKKLNELDAEARAQAERLFEEYFKGGVKNNRLEDMLLHIGSDTPNDWKLAIIEADIILDELLKEAGYAGVSLGEKLRSITPNQLQSIDDAWQAHKVRNQIAHAGSDFVLTHKLAQDTIKQYRRVFHELGVR
jgi:uncharacterized membrane protein